MYNKHGYPPAFQQAFEQHMQRTMLNFSSPPPFFSSELSNRSPMPSNFLTMRHPEEFDDEAESSEYEDDEDDAYTEAESQSSQSPSSLMKWSPPVQTSLKRYPKYRTGLDASKQMRTFRTTQSASPEFRRMDASFSHPEPPRNFQVHAEMTSLRMDGSSQGAFGNFTYSSVNMSGEDGGRTFEAIAVSQQFQSAFGGSGSAATFFSSGLTGGFGSEHLMLRIQISSSQVRRHRRERR